MKFLFAVAALLTIPITGFSQPHSNGLEIKLNTLNEDKLIPIYKECNNKVKITINGFSNYSSLKYSFEGGQFSVDKSNPQILLITPIIPKPKLIVSLNGEALDTISFKVRLPPKPSLILIRNKKLVKENSNISKKDLSNYHLIWYCMDQTFAKRFPNDANWTSKYKVIIKQKEKVIFDIELDNFDFSQIAPKILKKGDSISIQPIEVKRQCFDQRMLKETVGKVILNFQLI